LFQHQRCRVVSQNLFFFKGSICQNGITPRWGQFDQNEGSLYSSERGQHQPEFPLKRQDVSYALSRRVYDNVKDDKWNIAIVKLEPKRLKVENLLAAIAHTDFPHRQPTLDNNGVLSNKELYFINLEKKLIFNMYDDRGLDIIAKDIETLRPIFNRFSDWILDYDREEINEKMKNGL
jgi:hypothetical protein